MLAGSFLAAWFASLLLEAGTIGLLTGFWRAGGALASAGAAILIGRLRAAGMLSERAVRRLQMAALIFALAAGFFSLRPRQNGFAEPNARQDGGGSDSGKYRGVILWMPPKHQALVMAPRPEPGRGGRAKKQNWTIPFDGVYWFFKYPDRMPPGGSYSLSGDPTKDVFRSSDRFPLEMQARQNFANAIDLSCCSRIDIEISNTDPYPGAIFLELILSDLREQGEPRQSLGRRLVPSMPRRVSESEVRPARQALSFAIPGNPAIRQFDSAAVNFIRESARSYSSAKIAIEAFTLAPR